MLIGNDETEWEDLTGDTQRGRATLTVRLATDCYHDTHYTSGTYDHVRERRRLLRKVYRGLNRLLFRLGSPIRSDRQIAAVDRR